MTEQNPKISGTSILPLNNYVGLRVSKPMAVMLRTQALHHGTDVSSVMRQLIRDGADKRGIDTRFI